MDLYSLLSVRSIADVVRHGRLRWFGHLECKGVDDWALACRNVVVAGLRCVGRGRKWRVCKKNDMNLACSLNGQYSEMCGGTSFMGQRSNPILVWKIWTFSIHF